MICPACKAENPEEALVCHNCFEVFLSGPYLLPIIEFTQTLIKKYFASAISIEEFQNEIARMKDFILSKKEEGERFKPTEDTREIVFFAKDLLKDGTCGILEGIEVLEGYFKEKNHDALRIGLEKMLSSGKNLRYLNMLAELAGKIVPPPKICFNCGSSNPVTDNYCQKCNARLPKTTPDLGTSTIEFKEDQEQSYQSSNYLELKGALEEYAAKKISSMEFLEKINAHIKNLDFALNQIRQNPPHEKSPEHDLYSDIKSNLERYHKVLKDMSLKAKKDMPEILFEDLREIEALSQKLIRTQQAIQKGAIKS